MPATGRRAWLRHAASCALAAGGSGTGVLGPAANANANAATADEDSIRPGRRLAFPRDFGAHPGSRTEWWYITGWLQQAGRAAPPADAPRPELGFQITFFRSRTDLVPPDHPSRFAARQLLFAHAAVTDLREPGRARLRHDDRIAREGFGIAQAAREDTRLRLSGWTLRRDGPSAGGPHSLYTMAARSDAGGFELELTLAATQALLLQGQAGHSRKGPEVEQASHYYSQPQLAARGRVRLDDRWLDVQGTGWMDHEWSETLLAPGAVGWDWIGINLLDGRALTAFQLRRADGSALWAGGSLRTPAEAARAGNPPGGFPAIQGRSFGPDEVRFEAGRRWTSPATATAYPVQWTVVTPAGRHTVRALADAQELDSRGSTGSVYWEGLSELLDDSGRRVGLGYLEMTGYTTPLRIGG